MSPIAILSIMFVYFGILLFISQKMGQKDQSNASFFNANKNSKWYLVAFGMIGTALSGVTFISVPGEVGAPSGEQFKYFQFVLGNAIGFVLVATVLLPLYYKMQVISIYELIEKRLGYFSYKSAASIFLISRTIGSAFRLYLVVLVLQRYVFDFYTIPFAVTVLIALALIFAYTYKGGLKTIIITDTLQTLFLVTSVFFTIYFICDKLGYNIPQAFEAIKTSGYSQIFFWDNFVGSKFHFIKQIVGGIFVTLAVVGLDQDLMQKNLSCKSIKEAQKNMFTFTGIFVVINLFFLSVGALLYLYAQQNNIEVPLDMVSQKPRTDLLFPEIAFKHLAFIPSVIFLLGLTAATFATTDSALTALTTSFCVDFLGMHQKTNTKNEQQQIRLRHWVHIGFSFLMFVVIIIFHWINDASVVSMIFKIASYTYGPLLGLYTFALFIKNKKVADRWVPFVCLLSPAITFVFSLYATDWLGGYVFDSELIIVNGLITFMMLYVSSFWSKKDVV